MLDICQTEMKWLNMKINAATSAAIRVGSRFEIKCSPLFVDGVGIQFTDTIKYLGISVLSNNTFAHDINTRKCNFSRSLNGILSKLGNCAKSEILLIERIRTNCLPFLTYCIESFQNDKETVADLSSCWRKAFRKIFHFVPWASVHEIFFFVSILPLEYTIDLYRSTFFMHLHNIPNERILLVSKLCRNFNYRDLRLKYDVH